MQPRGSVKPFLPLTLVRGWDSGRTKVKRRVENDVGPIPVPLGPEVL